MGLSIHAVAAIGVRVSKSALVAQEEVRHTIHGRQDGKFCATCGAKIVEREREYIAALDDDDHVVAHGREYDVLYPQGVGPDGDVVIVLRSVETEHGEPIMGPLPLPSDDERDRFIDNLRSVGIPVIGFGVWAVDNSNW